MTSLLAELACIGRLARQWCERRIELAKLRRRIWCGEPGRHIGARFAQSRIAADTGARSTVSRHVNAYSGENSVDINTIPVDLIEGIDILTGGVSAIYGADGVSGVVNFRLKRNFEGLLAHGQTGISGRGDAEQPVRIRDFRATILGQGRGNITVAYEYNRSDRLNQHDRGYLGDPALNLQLLRNVDNPTRRTARTI